MIGEKSIVMTFKVRANQETHIVKVQANKNFGICDVYFSNEAANKFRSIIFNKFQGKQINDSEIVNQLRDLLTNLLRNQL